MNEIVSGMSGYSGGTAQSGPVRTNQESGVTDAFNRSKEAVSAAASSGSADVASDFERLRADFNNLKDTVSKLVSQVSAETTKGVREISQAAANQVGHAAAGMAEGGANIAASTTEQAKTLASELENVGRRNPLGAMAAALLVGVLFGLMGRSGRG